MHRWFQMFFLVHHVRCIWEKQALVKVKNLKSAPKYRIVVLFRYFTSIGGFFSLSHLFVNPFLRRAIWGQLCHLINVESTTPKYVDKSGIINFFSQRITLVSNEGKITTSKFYGNFKEYQPRVEWADAFQTHLRFGRKLCFFSTVFSQSMEWS